MDILCQASCDEVKAAVISYHLKHTSGQQGHDDEIAHVGDAVSYGLHPPGPCEQTFAESDQCSDYQPCSQHYRNIKSDKCKGDDEKVRNDQQDVYAACVRNLAYGQSHKYVESAYYEGGRTDNADVCLEFIPHRATLGAGCSNCCVGYEREVVSEEGTSYDDGSDECCQSRVCTDRVDFASDVGSDRYKRCNGTDAGSYGHGDEAGSDEQTGVKKIARQ